MTRRGWTRKERYKHIRSRTYSSREKAVSAALVLAMIFIEIYGIYYSLAARLSPVIPVLLMVLLFISLAVGVFFFDTFWYESY